MSGIKEYPLNYTLDEHIDLKGDVSVHTSEGFKFKISTAQKDPVDIRTNNYTNLILTKKDINDNVFEDSIKDRQDSAALPAQFITYLSPAAGAPVNTPTKFLAIEESFTTEGQVTCEGIPAVIEDIDTELTELQNRHYFELQFIEGAHNLVKISHYDTNKVVFLTYNYITGGLYFDVAGAPSIGSRSAGHCFSFTNYTNHREDPQIFEYFLDEATGYIKLMKFGFESVPGSASERIRKTYTVYADLSALSVTEEASFDAPSGGGDLSLSHMFKLELPVKVSTNDLASAVVTYTSDRLNIGSKIRDTRHNLILHDEFESKTPGNLNIIFLKNQLPNTFEQTQNNLIPGSNKVDYRDYTTLSTGGNQTKGPEKPGAVFNDHTAEIILRSDQVTYLHLPVDMYPYTKLYIGESGLIESGAVYGDSPQNSDKIFKKQANYKSVTEYGDPSGDLTGEWICSWLYSPTGKVKDTLWVDRYFDSTTYTWSQALSTSVDTIYETLIEQKNSAKYDTFNRGIFDVKSTLMFEPETYYAYHHLGNKDIKKYIDTNYSTNLIVDEFRELDFSTNITYDIPESINDESGFNLSFTLKKEIGASWDDPVSYHIIGNYSNTGFSVFNSMDYTPLSYIISTDRKSLNIYNINNKLISQLVIEPKDQNSGNNLSTEIIDYTVIEPLGNIYCLRADSSNYYLYEYNMDGAIVELTKLGIPVNSANSVKFIDDQLLILTNSQQVITVNLLSEKQSTSSQLPEDIAYLDNLTNKIYTAGDFYIYNNTQIRVIRPDAGGLYAETEFILMPTDSATSNDAKIKSGALDSSGNTYIIFKDVCDGELADYLISFDSTKNLRFIKSIDSLLDQNINDPDVNSVYNIRISTSIKGHVKVDTIIITRETPDNIIYQYAIDSKGEPKKAGIVPTNGDINTIKTFNNLKPDSDSNIITFKHKLHNIVDRDDVNIVSIDVDISKEFKGTEHHLTYDFNPKSGKSTVYIDGEEYKKVSVATGVPGKYTFTDFSRDSIRVGDIPYLNGSSFTTFADVERSFNSDFKILNIKLFNRSINSYNIRHIASQTSTINDIIWTVPYTRRHFLDEIDKVQKHELPGIKSNNIKIDVNSSVSIPGDLKGEILESLTSQIDEFIPANVNTADIDWSGSL